MEKKCFKDSIKKTKTIYEQQILELMDAINGKTDLIKLLFNDLEITNYPGKYNLGDHNYCGKFSTGTFREKRLCKCMYYYNGTCNNKCDECKFEQRYIIDGNYKIVDYEVPAYYYGNGIGEIDLVLEKDGVLYATEVKPYKNNKETLLRMIAEIITYTEGFEEGKYKRAIAFFKQNRDDGKMTPQYNEWMKATKEKKKILELVKCAKITVLCFEETDDLSNGKAKYTIKELWK